MLSPWKSIFASFRRITMGGMIPRVALTLHPRLRATRSARAFDLSGRAAVKWVIISFSVAWAVMILDYKKTNRNGWRFG